MGVVSLEDIHVTQLKRIPAVGGDVLHALKNSDYGFNGFGEVYFSWVEEGTIKAWKCHQHMTLNLVVPVGEVNFVFHLTNKKNIFRTEIIGEERYVRLTVPPGIWFGFQGLHTPKSLLMNIANIPHDPNEVEGLALTDINYDWN